MHRVPTPPASPPAARLAPSRVAPQRVAQALRAPAFRPRVAFHAARAVSAKYASEKKGDYPSMDFRIFFSEDGKPVSPWHNVPLHNADGTVNFICEIPKETKAKMEVATDEELTPIKQDTKKGRLREGSARAWRRRGPSAGTAPAPCTRHFLPPQRVSLRPDPYQRRL